MDQESTRAIANLMSIDRHTIYMFLPIRKFQYSVVKTVAC